MTPKSRIQGPSEVESMKPVNKGTRGMTSSYHLRKSSKRVESSKISQGSGTRIGRNNRGKKLITQGTTCTRHRKDRAKFNVDTVIDPII